MHAALFAEEKMRLLRIEWLLFGIRINIEILVKRRLSLEGIHAILSWRLGGLPFGRFPFVNNKGF